MNAAGRAHRVQLNRRNAMRSIRGWKRWLSHSFAVASAMLVAGLYSLASPGLSPVLAGYELPPGERITNLPHIPRSMPQKEAYEIYDPVIGRNFDLKNFWMRADLRVRPEYRNGVCFGGGAPVGGACNGFNPAAGTATRANQGKGASDFYVQQWTRLGIGYDLSDDVNFYFEVIDSTNWGSNGNANNAGNGGDPLNHSCGAGGTPSGLSTNCGLGVRAAYVLVRNLGGIKGLSMKAGRQYIVFGNHSLFGHFDWANTGYSHDGIMFQYSTKNYESYLGWFRNSESDLPQGASVAAGGPDIAGTGGNDANRDADLFLFYNQIKTVPGFVIEPYYVLYLNGFGSADNRGFGPGTAKHSNQTRHMVGGRIEMRKGNWDFITENAWQFGAMGDTNACVGQQKCLHINAWASRSWLGYTIYEHKWKPRLAVNLDYASGDGRNYCGTGVVGGTAGTGAACKTANTFENFFPT